MRPTTPEQVLRAGADVIRKYGWVRGQYGGTRVGYCIAGACYKALGIPPDTYIPRAVRDAITALMDIVGPESGAVAKFNDVHCHSADDAIAALEIAADLAAPTVSA